MREAGGIVHLKDALVDKYYARRDSAASSIQVLAAIQIIKEINYRQSPNRNQNLYDEDELVLDKAVIVGQILEYFIESIDVFVAIIQKLDGTILKVVSLLAAKFILAKLAYLYEVFEPYIVELLNKFQDDAI